MINKLIYKLEIIKKCYSIAPNHFVNLAFQIGCLASYFYVLKTNKNYLFDN